NNGDLQVGTLTATHADGTTSEIVGVNNSGDVSIAASGDLLIGEQLKTSENVFLDVSGTASQNWGGGVITAAGLGLSGGNYEFDRVDNKVDMIASEAGNVTFRNYSDLEVGRLTETDGDGNTLKTLD